jgi:putative Holliday junction resolvase
MRILALDLGGRRVGMAVSDPLALTAQGLPTVDRSVVLERLVDIIREYEVDEIVVGMPFHMNGGPSAGTIDAEQFAHTLRERFGLVVHRYDERLSTMEAERAMREMGRKPSRDRGALNRVAATLILQSFLDRRSVNGE